MIETIQEFSTKIIQNVEKVIIGKSDVIELVVVSLLCQGHVLLEDVPGTGKTVLGRSVAVSLGGTFKRLQCTPDLMPNDITGVSIFNQLERTFEFRRGPVFVNVLLADEINRATPRAQSALLEAMQEMQVTIDGETHLLPQPFLVIATQNPIEHEGTFVLPEAQLDRFLFRLKIGYPSIPDEKKLLVRLQHEHPIFKLEKVVEIDQLSDFQCQVWEVFVDDTLQDYIIQLLDATRKHPDLVLGASPRAGLSLFRASQGLAAVRGRDYVKPDDIKYLFPHVLEHRLILNPDSELRGRSLSAILNDLIQKIPLDLGRLS